jgi:hypothetical protein
VRPNEAETDLESKSGELSVLSVAIPNCSLLRLHLRDRRRAERLGRCLDLEAAESVALRGRRRIAAALDDGVLGQVAVDLGQHVDDLVLRGGLHERRLDGGAALEVDAEVQAARRKRPDGDQHDGAGDAEPEVLAAVDVGPPATLPESPSVRRC